MPDTITPDSNGARAMNGVRSWMPYGAAGDTGALIAQHAASAGTGPCSPPGARRPSPRWPTAWTCRTGL